MKAMPSSCMLFVPMSDSARGLAGSLVTRDSTRDVLLQWNPAIRTLAYGQPNITESFVYPDEKAHIFSLKLITG